MKSKVILTMIYDIKLFPPVISICNILSELNYEIVYIGGCSDMNTEKSIDGKKSCTILQNTVIWWKWNATDNSTVEIS